MDSYSALLQLVDELNEKIRREELEKDSQRREINRLKRELSVVKRKTDNSTMRGGASNGNDG